MPGNARSSWWSPKRVSLGFKVSMALTALLGASYFLLVTVLGSGFVAVAQGNAALHGTHVVESISGGIYGPLRRGDGPAVQETLADVVAQSTSVSNIRLLNPAGEVVYASDPAQLGTSISTESEVCTACHNAGPDPVPGRTKMRNPGEAGSFARVVFARPIANHRDCSTAECHAHSPDSKMLGLLEVELTLESVVENLKSSRDRSLLIAIGLMLVTILFVFLVIHHLVSRPLSALRLGAIKLSELDLTHRVPITSSDDIGEIANTLNETISYLEELLESIRLAVVQLNAATAELFATSGEQENAATDQSSAVEETRRTMEGLVGAANEIATGAGSVVSIAEQSMSASTVIGERIAQLNDQATSITEIAETIRGIAEKSDILALNASLEGTKAGEIGRGFALVGAEMRRLAESVMEAVVQVRQLASEIRELSQSAVLASEEGQKLARETTETSKRITLVTNQQRTATEQVRASMDELQNLALQTVRGATQSKATANDLMQTARALSAIIESAQLGGGQADDGSSQA